MVGGVGYRWLLLQSRATSRASGLLLDSSFPDLSLLQRNQTRYMWYRKLYIPGRGRGLLVEVQLCSVDNWRRLRTVGFAGLVVALLSQSFEIVSLGRFSSVRSRRPRINATLVSWSKGMGPFLRGRVCPLGRHNDWSWMSLDLC